MRPFLEIFLILVIMAFAIVVDILMVVKMIEKRKGK